MRSILNKLLPPEDDMKQAETYHVHKAICPHCNHTQEVDEGLDEEIIECEGCDLEFMVSTDLL